MSALAAACRLPIVLWNAQHDWVTLRHAGGHAGLHSERVLHWLGPLRYLGTQFGILLGFWFVVWGRALWRHRPGQEERPEMLYLWWLSAPVFVFFGLFSLKNGGGEPNWPVTAYLSGAVLAGAWLVEELQTARGLLRRWTIGATVGFAALGLLLTVLMHRLVWIQPILVRIAGPVTNERPLPLRKIDPTARLRGWRTLARAVDRLRDHLRRQGFESELAGAAWILPGELAFYCHGHPIVYSFGSALGERHSQYDLWRPNPVDDPDAFVGKTFIIVGGSESLFHDSFEQILTLSEVIHVEDGQPINRWSLLVGYRFHGSGRRASSVCY
jgi:hypothetical protein